VKGTRCNFERGDEGKRAALWLDEREEIIVSADRKVS
jgi:hypothetical protein